MSPRHRYTFYIDDPLAEALKTLKRTPGEEANESVHVRQAIRQYLMRKGFLAKSARKQVAARKRR